MTRFFLILIPVLFWSTSLSAQTDPLSVARTNFNSGNLAFEQGRWIDCAHDFERSFAAIFAPELLYNVGVCYQRAASTLADVDAQPLLMRSLTAYQRYLREIPNSPESATVSSEISSLQTRLAQIEATQVREPESEPEVEVPELAIPDLEVTASPEEIQEADHLEVASLRGEFPVTVLAISLSVVSTALAIGLGVHAQDTYTHLSATCGMTQEGCTESQIGEVSSFALGSNLLYGLAGLSLSGGSVAFGFEFTATSTGSISQASIRVGGSF